MVFALSGSPVRLPLSLSEASRLEFDLGHEGVDLSRAQRIDVRLFSGTQAQPPARPDEPPSDALAPSA